MKRMVVGCGVGLALALAAAVAIASSRHETYKSAYGATFHDTYVSGGPTSEIHHGTYKLTISKGSSKGLGLSALLKGTYVAVLDAPQNSDDVTGTALIRPTVKAAGTLCVTFTASFDQQSNATATLKTAGGTGKGAALHATAKGKTGVPLSSATGSVTAYLGARTHPSSACAALASQH
jgi:hypothetical protein